MRRLVLAVVLAVGTLTIAPSAPVEAATTSYRYCGLDCGTFHCTTYWIPDGPYGVKGDRCWIGHLHTSPGRCRTALNVTRWTSSAWGGDLLNFRNC